MNIEELKTLIKECLAELEREKYISELNDKQKVLIKQTKFFKILSIITLTLGICSEIYIYLTGNYIDVISHMIPITLFIVSFCSFSTFLLGKVCLFNLMHELKKTLK
jgi:hypothetical protein